MVDSDLRVEFLTCDEKGNSIVALKIFILGRPIEYIIKARIHERKLESKRRTKIVISFG